MCVSASVCWSTQPHTQAGRAGDVGDDVVELKIHLCQCLLHMLDVSEFDQTLPMM
jgi:hypothetical protein